MMTGEFDHFMWLKVTGGLDNCRMSDYGAASIPSESYIKYQRNLKILKQHGIYYPNWEEAQEVLRRIERRNQ